MPTGLHPIDPTGLLVSGARIPGAAIALPRAGRRALAVEVQALVGSPEGPARRQATGLDARRFQLVAAVLDRVAGLPLGRAELFGATSGGVRIDDPACDLAVAAALASAATGVAPPAGLGVRRGGCAHGHRAAGAGHGAAALGGPRGGLYHGLRCGNVLGAGSISGSRTSIAGDAISATPSVGCVRRLLERVRARFPIWPSDLVRIGPCFPSHRPLTCGFGLRRKAGPC